MRYRVQTRDDTYRYPGLGHGTGVCRLRTYEADGLVPVVIVTELPESAGVSITTMAEYLAAEVVARYFPERFEEDEPVVWIEHNPTGTRKRSTFHLVSFSSWTPHIVTVGQQRRVRVGAASWRRLSPTHIAALVGALEEAPAHGPVAAKHAGD